jgi:multicomponent Na+:H+ antiporter subunit E
MNRKEKTFGILITFGILFLFWILLSGLFDAFHLIAGVICSGIVTLMSHDLLVKGKDEKFIEKSLRLLWYIPWELWQIVLANIDVAIRVLHPKMPIDPLIIEFETPLRSDFSLITLANSITLTPGTITISVEPEKGMFRVHAIAKEPADALLVDQTMQKKVAEVFFVEWPGTDQRQEPE